MSARRDVRGAATLEGVFIDVSDEPTGFGSFIYLRRFPLRYLKIDMSFVRNLAVSSEDQRVVRSIISLARDFGQRTIAEGVEDEETLILLRRLGVDYAQGFHIGRPAPI